MPQSIFNALELAFLSGQEYAHVNEIDFIVMSHQILLSHGSENN